MAGVKWASLSELAAARSSKAEAHGALEFMLQWSVTRRALGRPPRLWEYTAWWGVSRSTAFRAQRRFRRCFPSERTPDRLLDVVAGAWDEREGLGGLSAVHVPLYRLLQELASAGVRGAGCEREALRGT
ncbi:MAG: hypothetical protein QOK04_1631 [Solirubrobacteraceae bacterium]|jgi:hypothetical protein|nr:hypothetical protein [Solirubrobacteraceae bacterium]